MILIGYQHWLGAVFVCVPKTIGNAGSPGDYVESYGAGGFDINNLVYGSSSSGPADVMRITKPNISAPAVSVRSSIPPGSYVSFIGTSMASPHVAATVIYGMVVPQKKLLGQSLNIVYEDFTVDPESKLDFIGGVAPIKFSPGHRITASSDRRAGIL